MTNLFRIRDIDLADSEGLPAFIEFCQDNDVNFYIEKVKGPNGFPTCVLISSHRPSIMKVMVEYCGGDERAAVDLFDEKIEAV